MWDFVNANGLLGSLADYLRPYGWCVGLTGSVLTRGHSEKDLDVILYRAGSTRSVTKGALDNLLEEFGFKNRTTPEFLVKQSQRDTKNVEVWEFADKRVDIFFLG